MTLNTKVAAFRLPWQLKTGQREQPGVMLNGLDMGQNPGDVCPGI